MSIGEIGMNKISDIIRKRIENKKRSYLSNDNITEFIEPEEFSILLKEVEEKVEDLLKSLIIDVKNDHNSRETPARLAKMFINEIFSGRYHQKPRIKSFPNIKQYDQIYITGPIPVRSTCAHHFQAIKGNCWVGIYPGENVIGLSKFNRLVEWVSSRPQIQEEMTGQIGDLIEEETRAKGVAVIIKAEHQCMTHRGVKAHETEMMTSVLRGEFLKDSSMKNELLILLQNMRGY